MAVIKPKSVRIIYRRFILRPFRQSDIPALVKHINDKTIAGNTLAIPYPYKLKHAHIWLRRLQNIARRKNPSMANFVIEIEGELVGSIAVFKIHDHKAEVGYWLSRQYWGRGIMTEAVKEIARFSRNQLGLRRIYAYVFPHNKASARVLEKSGFKFEGLLRKNVKKGEKLLDELLYARLL